MNLTPAHDEQEFRKRKEAIELCGKNRGAHDYIPIEWKYIYSLDAIDRKRVTKLLCRVCFSNVEVQTLINHYSEIKPL